ncbi:DUF2521 family protein [Bacillus sp. CGMCC 1.16541]|uniref:DUF2521 family protein n=1 Tax=Bacillus sp. CGMCC 1.16541 TaxID=2185143 RepID=UPI000D736BC4|nr:DUF2521 family protein [Bacillus sp. CGMCC 1.16541]
MNVIMSLKEKRLEKQMVYERKMLRELSVDTLRDRIETYFEPLFIRKDYITSSIEEGCMDIAIESYLLGARFSRFGYYGEPENDVKVRCALEEKMLIDALYDYLNFWSPLGEEDLYQESIYYICEQYVHDCWTDGFQKGEKRYRLRLK